MSETLLEAVGLCRDYPDRSGSHRMTSAVDHIDLRVRTGEAFGIIGSSGAGKSTLARLLLALEKPDGGTVYFDGRPISTMTSRQVRPLRRRFQAVFQDPVASLDPRLTVGTIVSEPLVAFRAGNTAQRRSRVAELLALVGLPADASERLPGEFSGGERQRIAIARAVALEPDLLILDEPVSFLDISIRGQILRLLVELRRRYGLTMVLVSHDLRVVGDACDRMAVLLRGRVVEQGPVTRLIQRPAHPYTQALVAATPILDPAWRPPQLRSTHHGSWPAGACRYACSCPESSAACREEPDLVPIGDDHHVRCWHPVDS